MNKIVKFKIMKDGYFLGKGGHFGQVFRMKPPMCINKEDADLTLAVLEDAIHSVANSR